MSQDEIVWDYHELKCYEFMCNGRVHGYDKCKYKDNDERIMEFLTHINNLLKYSFDKNNEQFDNINKRITDLINRINGIEEMIKFMPNGQIYEECKEEFETLK